MDGVRGTGIKSWPAGERPRERLMRVGPAGLSDGELLAILLRTGTRGVDALQLAGLLLAGSGSLRGLARKSMLDLSAIRGIGPAKSAELVAALELGRRAQAAPDEARPLVRTPADAARRIIPRLRDLDREVFLVLILDSTNSVQQEVEVSRGTLNASLVHPREVFRAVIEHRAAAIIVAHNHPSGNPDPSQDDLAVTRQLAETGKVVGIPLHDHLIIGGNRYISLAERGIL